MYEQVNGFFQLDPVFSSSLDILHHLQFCELFLLKALLSTHSPKQYLVSTRQDTAALRVWSVLGLEIWGLGTKQGSQENEDEVGWAGHLNVFTGHLGPDGWVQTLSPRQASDWAPRHGCHSPALLPPQAHG